MKCRSVLYRIRPSLALVLLSLILSRDSFASFSPLAVGARASGMGEAFTAAADDVYSLYYNPAGLAQLERPELGTYYSQLFTGLGDGSNISRSFVGYAQPLGSPDSSYGSLGLDYINLDLSGLYKEETFGFSYAYQFLQKFNLGASLKILRKTIGSDDPSTSNAIDSTTGQPFSSAQSDPLFSNGQSKTAPAIDVGGQYELFHHYWIGAAIRNINSPNMAIGGGDSDPAPTYSTIGIARKNFDSILDMDISQYNTTVNNIRISVGGEKWIDAIGLRAGLAFGTQDYASGSFGASYRFQNFQLDYAMNLPIQGVQGTYGNQQISLTVRFGEEPTSRLEGQIADERKMRLEAESRAIELRNEQEQIRTQIRQLTIENNDFQPQINNSQNKTANYSPDRYMKRKEYEYKLSMKYYRRLVENGTTIDDRRTMIELIIKKYGKVGFDISAAQDELKTINKINAPRETNSPNS